MKRSVESKAPSVWRGEIPLQSFYTAGLGGQRLPGVELDHLHRALRRGIDAQLAEHALVQVFLDDPDAAIVRLGEDVDRARFLERVGAFHFSGKVGTSFTSTCVPAWASFSKPIASMSRRWSMRYGSRGRDGHD